MKNYILYLITMLLIGIGSILVLLGAMAMVNDLVFIGLICFILSYVVDTFNKIDGNNFY